MAKLMFLKGVRVQRPGLIDVEVPACGFKVLDNGALQLEHANKRTFAPGMWQSAELVFTCDEGAAL